MLIPVLLSVLLLCQRIDVDKTSLILYYLLSRLFDRKNKAICLSSMVYNNREDIWVVRSDYCAKSFLIVFCQISKPFPCFVHGVALRCGYSFTL